MGGRYLLPLIRATLASATLTHRSRTRSSQAKATGPRPSGHHDVVSHQPSRAVREMRFEIVEDVLVRPRR